MYNVYMNCEKNSCSENAVTIVTITYLLDSRKFSRQLCIDHAVEEKENLESEVKHLSGINGYTVDVKHLS